MHKVSILLTDHSWIEGTQTNLNDIGITLRDIYKSKPDSLETVPFPAKQVLVPWANILLKIDKE